MSIVPGGRARLRILATCTWMAMAAAALATAAPLEEPPPASTTSSTTASGERLYLEGELPSGATLHATRPEGPLDGAAAACVNCHQRSGLGSYEGPLVIPPIIGPYLFREGASVTSDLGLPHIPGYTPRALAYDLASLERALRTGVAPGGHVLGTLMPRYELDRQALTDLVAYLQQLGTGPVPGVGDETLEFATVVAPDADPLKLRGMLDVLEAYFAARNERVSARVQGSGQRGTGEYRAARRWHLSTWTLSGPRDTWLEQLRQRQAREPVFALVAGLGRGDWTPVDRFCEQQRVPCLMAEADQPAEEESGVYAMHYTRGVYLEADLLLARISGGTATSGDAHESRGHIVQVFRPDDIGAAAAAHLGREARALGLPVEERVLGAGPAAGQLEATLAGLGTADSLVLWLRPDDVAALREPGAVGAVYASGLMAGFEDAPLPPAWRARVQMAFPHDTPALRRVRMNFPHAWFRSHGIVLRDERTQSDAWLTCTILADALDNMLDSYLPDYLVERVAGMLGGRHNSAYYPRLGLEPGQRFASKGGYVAHYDSGTSQWTPLSGWMVP